MPKIRFHHEVVYIQIYWISMAIWSVKKGQLKSTKNQHSLFFSSTTNAHTKHDKNNYKSNEIGRIGFNISLNEGNKMK